MVVTTYKQEYSAKLENLINSYTRVIIVQVDNVGSNQLQQIRLSIRGKAVLLMGKNTMIRKIMTLFVKSHPGHPINDLIPQIIGNVGLVFTNEDLSQMRKLLEENKVPAPARAGAISPIDVIIPTGPTECDPSQTSFFQSLQIATKIVKGKIEITTAVNLLKKGDKVGQSESALLQKLHIKPFTYGLSLVTIYDNGSLFAPSVLDITNEILISKFTSAVRNIASISLSIGYPTSASIPHSIANAFKSLVAVAVECEEFTFEKANPFKAYLKDPSAFASAVVVTTSNTTGNTSAVVEEKKAESESEVDIGAGGMFGGGDATGDY